MYKKYDEYEEDQTMPCADQVALVTGGSRGIGRAISLALADRGADVAILFAQRSYEAEKVVEQITNYGQRARAYQVDVSQAQAVHTVAQQVLADWGPVSILVNNAGIARSAPLSQLPEEDWQAVLDVNLNGAFHVTKAFLPMMEKQRYGRIVNISSIAALCGSACKTNYAASKAGLLGFTRSLAREVAHCGITVNAIAPGFFNTELSAKRTKEQEEDLLAAIPAGRCGEPSEIARAVTFLAVPEAGYITGQTLQIDGGLTMALGYDHRRGKNK